MLSWFSPFHGIDHVPLFIWKSEHDPIDARFLVSQTLGFVLLGGVQVHALNVTGLVINTAGGVWYSYSKYNQKKNKPPRAELDVEAHSK